MSSTPISVVIITYNESRQIEECLHSVEKIADEVIVVDSFSTDGTQQICKEWGAAVVEHAFDGYRDQKNYALSLANHNMILSLDADERLSDELIMEIKSIKEKRTADGYSMKRKNFYGMKWIRYGGWYPDRKVRLFNRQMGRWAGGNLHEYVEMDPEASIAALDGNLLHYTIRSVEAHRAQVKRFGEVGARSLQDKSLPFLILKCLASPIFRFFKMYLLKLGFLDGREGWLIASLTSLEVYLKYSGAIKLKINTGQ